VIVPVGGGGPSVIAAKAATATIPICSRSAAIQLRQARRELQRAEWEAVGTLGRQFHIVNAGSEGEIDSVFAALVERRVGALVEGSDPFLFGRRRPHRGLSPSR